MSELGVEFGATEFGGIIAFRECDFRFCPLEQAVTSKIPINESTNFGVTDNRFILSSYEHASIGVELWERIATEVEMGFPDGNVIALTAKTRKLARPKSSSRCAPSAEFVVSLSPIRTGVEKHDEGLLAELF